MLTAEADALAAFRMKWTLKLAKAAAAAFADASAAYRRRTGLEAFAADADDWSASAQSLCAVHGQPGAWPSTKLCLGGRPTCGRSGACRRSMGMFAASVGGSSVACN